MGERCLGNFLAIFRYGGNTHYAFTLREYLLPGEAREFANTGKLPATHGKCLLCTRYFLT